MRKSARKIARIESVCAIAASICSSATGSAPLKPPFMSSSRCRKRVNGVLRSWAMSVETCRSPAMRASIRSSMRFRLVDRSSNSGLMPIAGSRSDKLPCMMRPTARLTRSSRRRKIVPTTRPPINASKLIPIPNSIVDWPRVCRKSLRSDVSLPTTRIAPSFKRTPTVINETAAPSPSSPWSIAGRTRS